MNQNDPTIREMCELGRDVLESRDMQALRTFHQHGVISRYEHCLSVCYIALRLADKWHVDVDRRSMVRGALLHDYYLYDWHEKEAWHKWHGFRHPRFAMENAQRDFHLSEKEIEIIRKHMWPLTIIPPRCKEAWIVNGTDTWISLIESAARFRCLSALRRSWIDRPLRLSLRYAEDAGRQASTFTAKEE